MSLSLATKYRPKDFSDVVEQNISVKILQKVVETKNFPHALLFVGPSGCGKTTLARLFANAINEGQGTPIEIDAASNNGVDQVRQLVTDANIMSLTSLYKVYIIDECHAITSQGWQAFLKGIEEPSAYTIYIFCTTEPNKIPATVLNRVQRYNLTRISTKGVYDRLVSICQKEGFTNYEATCELISKRANGGMRDAITLLDQCATLSTDLDINITKELLGDFSYEAMIKFTNNIIDKKEDQVLAYINYLYINGYDLKSFINTYLECVIDFNKYLLFRDISLTGFPSYLEKVEDQSINLRYVVGIEHGVAYFNWLADKLLNIKTTIKNDPAYKSTIEVLFLNICRGK